MLANKKVHADASNFEAGVSKAEAYGQVLEQARALFDGQRNWVCMAMTFTFDNVEHYRFGG